MTLQSEGMGKLVAGKSVLRYSAARGSYIGVFANLFGDNKQMVRINLLDRPKLVCGGDADDFTLIGTLTDDGWIEGEWAENPVPGMVIDLCGPGNRQHLAQVADEWAWDSIIAFRPAHREAQPETDGGGRAEVLERIRAMDSKAVYSESDYERLADDLQALLPTPEGQTEGAVTEAASALIAMIERYERVDAPAEDRRLIDRASKAYAALASKGV